MNRVNIKQFRLINSSPVRVIIAMDECEQGMIMMDVYGVSMKEKQFQYIFQSRNSEYVTCLRKESAS
jgi:hypothetical protein